MSHSQRSLLTRRQFVAGASALALIPHMARASSEEAPWPLWQVEGYGGRAFVFGETLPRRTDWHDERILSILSKSGRLWTETNQVYRKPVKELVQRFGMTPAGSSSSLLTAEDKRRLADAARYCKVSSDDLAGMRPWLIGASLEDAFFAAAGLTGRSANTVLSAAAARIGIPISSEFATKDDVFAWFAAMSPEEEVQYLRYILDEIEMGPAGAERISSAWIKGDPRPAELAVGRLRHRSPQLFQVLTAARNEAWVPRFLTALQSGQQALFVLGLYHMVDSFGVPAELRRAGLNVTQL